MAIIPNGASNHRRRLRRGTNRRGTKIPRTRRPIELERLPIAADKTKAMMNGRFVTAAKRPVHEPQVKLIEPNGTAHLVTETERRVAQCLQAARLEYEYERREFLVPRADGSDEMMAFRPDFYVPEYDVYLEVTAGSSDHERALARRRRKAAYVHAMYGVTIILLGYAELRELRLQKVTLHELIMAAAEAGNDALRALLEAEADGDQRAA